LALDDASLSIFLDQCHARRHPARAATIFRPGDTSANTLYYVVSGSLSISSVEPTAGTGAGLLNAGEIRR
jgi:CRP-like cAMP-binding protein